MAAKLSRAAGTGTGYRMTHLSFAGLFVALGTVVGGALERSEGPAGALVLASSGCLDNSCSRRIAASELHTDGALGRVKSSYIFSAWTGSFRASLSRASPSLACPTTGEPTKRLTTS